MQFRPSISLSVILITLAAVFLRLGVWQLERKEEKAALFAKFEQAPALGIEEALRRSEAFARVAAYGAYDPTRHVLLDNRIWRGRPGVHALTPFRLADGRLILVNRGWLPLPADRSSLPEVPTGSAARTIHGRLARVLSEGPRLGGADILRTDQWPQLITYLDLDDVSASLGESVQPWIVQLDADDPSGFGDRQWSPAVMEPSVHGAYAFQWMALAAAAIIIWIIMGVRRAGGLKSVSSSRPPSDSGGGR